MVTVYHILLLGVHEEILRHAMYSTRPFLIRPGNVM
jgi:hypothetical protein